MATCPHCHQFINSQATSCPHCHRQLKAFGHPGIPLHHAEKEVFLCETCIYDQDDSCNFPKRPYAKTCTLYHHQAEPLVASKADYRSRTFRAWLRNYQVPILIATLIAVSIVLAISF
jgi:hypothetical protein